MKPLLIAAITLSNLVVLAADADEGRTGRDVSGVWYGMGDGASLRVGGRPVVELNPPPLLYVLELTAAGDEVEGALTVGAGIDLRTPRRRAMGRLGLPGNEGPKVPEARPIAGAVDRSILVVETTTFNSTPTVITAEIGGSRMRAEVRTGEDVRMVVLRRCRPARNAADDDCSVDTLWDDYLRKSRRRLSPTPRPPTAEQIQRANVPPDVPPK